MSKKNKIDAAKKKALHIDPDDHEEILDEISRREAVEQEEQPDEEDSDAEGESEDESEEEEGDDNE